jgi:hypothetical protein
MATGTGESGRRSDRHRKFYRGVQDQCDFILGHVRFRKTQGASVCKLVALITKLAIGVVPDSLTKEKIVHSIANITEVTVPQPKP